MLLCRNKDADRPSFLGFDPDSLNITEDVALDYLAEILVEIFQSETYEHYRQQKKSRHLLPGFDQRAGG